MEEPKVITIGDVIDSTVMHINKGKAREGIRQAVEGTKGVNCQHILLLVQQFSAFNWEKESRTGIPFSTGSAMLHLFRVNCDSTYCTIKVEIKCVASLLLERRIVKISFQQKFQSSHTTKICSDPQTKKNRQSAK